MTLAPTPAVQTSSAVNFTWKSTVNIMGAAIHQSHCVPGKLSWFPPYQ